MPHTQLPPHVHSYPAPAVLIGCGSIDEPNLITCAWFGTVASDPPHVAVGIRPERFSHSLIVQSGEFTVNIPTRAQLDAVKHCGSASGRDSDKFAHLGWHAVPAPPLGSAPMAAETPINLACRVVDANRYGSHTLFVGEIMALHAEENLVRPSQRPDPFAAEQLVYLDGRYWSLLRNEP